MIIIRNSKTQRQLDQTIKTKVAVRMRVSYEYGTHLSGRHRFFIIWRISAGYTYISLSLLRSVLRYIISIQALYHIEISTAIVNYYILHPQGRSRRL